jgi:hypothetical protein
VYFLCDLKPHAKFHNPWITPAGRKVTWAEREKERKAFSKYRNVINYDINIFRGLK